jgi:hypothetical protein
MLSETIAAPIVKKSGNRWKVVLAKPGKGNSGTYSAQVLREQGPDALPAGTKAFIGHALPQDRNPKDQFGKYPEGAYYDDTLDPVKYPEGALVAELEVFNRYKDMIDEIGTDAELSMFILDGGTDAEGNVVEMNYNRANSCDLVSYAGLENSGLIEKLTESYSFGTDTSDRPPAQDEKKEVMLDKDTLDAITASVRLALADLAEAPKVKTEAEVQADIDAKVEAEVGAKVDEAVAEYEGKIAQIAAVPELLPSQVESLKAEARKGTDITSLIESAKAIVAEAKTTLTESFTAGSPYFVEGAAKTEDWTVR